MGMTRLMELRTKVLDKTATGGEVLELNRSLCVHLDDLEERGLLDLSCPGCASDYVYYKNVWPLGTSPFHPPHKASSLCESGKHPHCTCATCF